MLDVAYRTIDSPVGALLLAATERGLVRVAYAIEGHDAVLQRLAAEVSPRILLAPARLDAAARELDEYFAGTRRGFDLTLDLSRSTRVPPRRADPAARRSATARPRATPRSPCAAGSPRAVRAVGSACATNPLPLVVPCHRVVRSDGTAGDYVGGREAKRILLSLEAA